MSFPCKKVTNPCSKNHRRTIIRGKKKKKKKKSSFVNEVSFILVKTRTAYGKRK